VEQLRYYSTYNYLPVFLKICKKDLVLR